MNVLLVVCIKIFRHVVKLHCKPRSREPRQSLQPAVRGSDAGGFHAYAILRLSFLLLMWSRYMHLLQVNYRTPSTTSVILRTVSTTSSQNSTPESTSWRHHSASSHDHFSSFIRAII